jgi:hypothetical protein
MSPGSPTHGTIPRPPVRFLSLYAHLPADGRWEGRGTPPARLNAFCQHEHVSVPVDLEKNKPVLDLQP